MLRRVRVDDVGDGDPVLRLALHCRRMGQAAHRLEIHDQRDELVPNVAGARDAVVVREQRRGPNQ